MGVVCCENLPNILHQAWFHVLQTAQTHVSCFEQIYDQPVVTAAGRIEDGWILVDKQRYFYQVVVIILVCLGPLNSLSCLFRSKQSEEDTYNNSKAICIN